MKKYKKLIPLFMIILVIIGFYIFGLERFFSFSFLQEYHSSLRKAVSEQYFLFLVGFSLTYIIVTATSLPIAAFLTILGGFLFGPFISLIVVTLSATFGTTLLFLIIKSNFGEMFQQMGTPWIKKMEKGFQEDAFFYLLSIRLVPIFPFWAVTIAAALLEMRLKAFFLATLIGIIPGAFVYALVGNGLDALLSQGKTPDLTIIFDPEIFLPLCGLALLSLLPILYKHRKRKT